MRLNMAVSSVSTKSKTEKAIPERSFTTRSMAFSGKQEYVIQSFFLFPFVNTWWGDDEHDEGYRIEIN